MKKNMRTIKLQGNQQRTKIMKKKDYHDPRMCNIYCPSRWCNKNGVTSLRISIRNPITQACMIVYI